jgi:DNA ligase-1
VRRFSQLCQQLESVPFTRSKAEILADYLQATPQEDATWALYLLLGGQLARVVDPPTLEKWILEESKLPGWLWQECREQAADFAETVALVAELSRVETPSLFARDRAAKVKDGGGESDNDDQLSLGAWIAQRLQPVARQAESVRRQAVLGWWRTLSLDVSWAVHALAFGRFPVHVPKRVVDDALRLVGGEAAVAGLTARLEALPLSAAQKPSSLQLDLFS